MVCRSRDLQGHLDPRYRLQLMTVADILSDYHKTARARSADEQETPIHSLTASQALHSL